MPRPYNHAQFRPGLNVYVDPAIRNIHPLSPIAGQIVQTCMGTMYEVLEPFEDQARFVPVRWQGQEFLVEEEYILIDSAADCRLDGL